MLVAVPVILLCGALPSHGRSVTQTIRLKPGWNAVFLEVAPAAPACADVFAGVPGLASVWSWDPGRAGAEFVQDPATLVPGQPQWRAWFPANPAVSDLAAIEGERPYLIQLGGPAAVDWTVSGEPTLPRPRWRPDAFNLVGFHLEPGAEPFFGDFFASSPAHAGQAVYYLGDLGTWQRVTAPETTRMKHGEALWVFCLGQSAFAGPLALELGGDDGLDYGDEIWERTLGVRNLAAAGATVALAASGDAPLLFGTVAPADGAKGWQELPASVALPAGGQRTVRIGTRRSGLAPGQAYASNLTITNGSGVRLIVPASVEGISHAGLWVGTATVYRVSEPRVAPAQGFPLTSPERGYETGAPFPFRLILHVDAAGQARLLKQSIQMWDAAAGRYVLFSDDALVARYGAAEEGPGSLQRRISTSAFGALSAAEPRFEAPMTGVFAEAGGSLSVTIVTGPDDPLNPFRHQYHPDHAEAAQVPQVTRNIEMVFSATDADGDPLPFASGLAWGGSDMGGIYRETIEGLNKAPIRVEGAFLLQRASAISSLEHR